MNKQQLASKIWESANKMRSNIEANKYKDYILGFIFYKFLSENEESFLRKEGWTDSDLIKELIENEETVKYCQDNLGYFITYENLFSTWIKKGKNTGIDDVTVAISAFNRNISDTHKKVYEKIFGTLETGLSNLGNNASEQSKAIRDLIHLINSIPMGKKQDYDVLGFIYEYLIGMFAANAGKKGGEFYTPYEVSMLMSDIVAFHLKDKKSIGIYDPTSGSGSLLITIGQAIARHFSDDDNVKYYAQEKIKETYDLTRMNLVMRGIKPDNIVTRNGDTLKDDWPYFDDDTTYTTLWVDAVVSNPPYSQHWEPKEDPRYAGFGLAPKTKADYAFLLHDLFHVKDDGIMTIILPHGVLFRGGEEATIRKQLIEHNHIDTIIGLPANIFFGTGIPTIVMVLKKHARENSDDVLIIDASKGFIKSGNKNKLQTSNIRKIVDTYISRISIDGFSRVVSRDEIRANDFNLNIPRYVDSSSKNESYDIYATMNGGIPNSEIDNLKDYWSSFPRLRNELFRSNDIPYSELLSDDTTTTINNNQDVINFRKDFETAFANFDDYLNDLLVKKINKLSISKTEDDISKTIFDRLDNIPLIDKYDAYQIFSDSWKQIAIDLEIMQSEGLDRARKINSGITNINEVDISLCLVSAKIVDPNMVLKKKGDAEEEVQDGWIGRIIPFDLIWSSILKTDYNELKSKNDRLLAIDEEIKEFIDLLTEEEKENDFFDIDKSSFINAEIAKEAKKLSKEFIISDLSEEDVEYKVLQVNSLIEESKQLKKQTKEELPKLIIKTKVTIENLTDDQVLELLRAKWINQLTLEISKLPDMVVKNLVQKVKKISEKYSETLVGLEYKINESEKVLSNLLEDLTGDEFDIKGIKELQKLLGDE